MNIEGAKILVTGGCGLIGSTTIDQLLREDVGQIVIYDNLVRGSMHNVAEILKDKRVTLVKGDIRDVESTRRVTEGMDAVIHMAAIRITACAENPREAMEVMCNGSFNVVEAAHLAGVKNRLRLDRFDLRPRRQLPDDGKRSPVQQPHLVRRVQDHARRAAALFQRHVRHGLRRVPLLQRLRPADGHPRQVHRSADPLDGAHRSWPTPLILGDGKTSMDFIYIDDIARANVAGLKSNVSDEVFNVASSVETSLNELAEALMRVMGKKLTPEYGPERKVNAVPRRLASTEKAKRLLGWEAQVGLDEGLERLVAWWRANKEHVA